MTSLTWNQDPFSFRFEIKFWWKRQKRECMEAAKIGPDLSLWPAVHVKREQNNRCHTTEEFPLFYPKAEWVGTAGNPLLGPVSRKCPWRFRSKIKYSNQISRKQEPFLAKKPVYFVLLTDSFIISSSKQLKPRSWVQTKTAFRAGPLIIRPDFRETGSRSFQLFLPYWLPRTARSNEFSRPNKLSTTQTVGISFSRRDTF